MKTICKAKEGAFKFEDTSLYIRFIYSWVYLYPNN